MENKAEQMKRRLSHSIVTRGAPSFANTETNMDLYGSAAGRARRRRVIFPMMIQVAALAAVVFSGAAAAQPMTGDPPTDTEPEVTVLSLHLSTILTSIGVLEPKLRIKEGEFAEILILADPLTLRDLVVNFAFSATGDPAGDKSTGSETLEEGFAIHFIADKIFAVDNQVVDPLRSTHVLSLLDGEHYTVGSPSTAPIVVLEGVCDRTPQVQDAVLAKVAQRHGLMVADDPGSNLGGGPGGNPGGGDPSGGVPGGGLSGGLPSGGGLSGGLGNNPDGNTIDCSLSHQSVKNPEAELARILDVNLSSQNVTALKQGDFLDLDGLRLLDLSRNRISTLTGGILADAGALTDLHLQENRLSTLTAGMFSGLANLRRLELHDNRLSTLPTGVFSGLTFLSELNLSSNRLSALPPNLFVGLSGLQQLDLSGNDGAPFTLTPRWRRTGSASPGAAEVKLIIEEGAPTFVAIDLSAEDGTVLPQVVFIQPGSTESETVRVRQTSNEAVVVRMNVPSLPVDRFIGIRTTAGESFVLDEIGPSVSGVEIISTPAQDDAYLSPDNETILVAVGFDGEVEVTTSTAGPALTLGIGDEEHAARYVPERSGASRLVFGYVLEAGDSDPNGVSVGNDALRLNGARITDASQNPASTALGVHAIPNAAGHAVIGRKLTLSFEPPTVRVAAGATTRVELVLGNAQVLTGGENLSVVLTPTPGVELPASSPVTMGRTLNRIPVSPGFAAAASVTTGKVTASASLPNARIISGVLSLQRLPTVSFDFDGAPVVEVAEGATAALTARLDFAPQFPVVVHYHVGGDHATAADYTDPGGGNVTIAAGKTTGMISIGIVDDTEIEATSESFTLALSPGGYGLGSPNTALIVIREGVCDRTERVQEGILHAAGATDCAEVTAAGLRGIASLYYASSGLTALRGRDFSGLENLLELNLRDNRLEALPLDVFLPLVKLRVLDLSGNRLGELPEGIVSDLTALRTLNLHDNRLTEAPTFPAPAGKLGTLEILTLSSNRLSVLPQGIFAGLSGLRSLWLGGNAPGASFDAAGDAVLSVDFKRPGVLSATPTDVFTRLILRQGAPFDLDVALQARGGRVSPARVTLAAGEVESDPITVTQTAAQTTVTLTAPPVPDEVCPETGQRCWRGFYFVAGDPFSAAGAVPPGVRLKVRVFLEGALE